MATINVELTEGAATTDIGGTPRYKANKALLEAAIASASAGDVIQLPAGRFFIYLGTELKSGITIQGHENGTTLDNYYDIVGDISAPMLFANNKSDITVQNLTIEGRWAVSGTVQKPINSSFGLRFFTCSNCMVRHVTFGESMQYNALVTSAGNNNFATGAMGFIGSTSGGDPSTGNSVIRCRFRHIQVQVFNQNNFAMLDCEGGAVNLIDVDHVEIKRCHFAFSGKETLGKIITANGAIALSRTSNLPVASGVASNVLVENCTITGPGFPVSGLMSLWGNHNGIGTTGSMIKMINWTIRKNVIRGWWYGICIGNSFANVVEPYADETNILIEDNYFFDILDDGVASFANGPLTIRRNWFQRCAFGGVAIEASVPTTAGVDVYDNVFIGMGLAPHTGGIGYTFLLGLASTNASVRDLGANNVRIYNNKNIRGQSAHPGYHNIITVNLTGSPGDATYYIEVEGGCESQVIGNSAFPWYLQAPSGAVSSGDERECFTFYSEGPPQVFGQSFIYDETSANNKVRTRIRPTAATGSLANIAVGDRIRTHNVVIVREENDDAGIVSGVVIENNDFRDGGWDGDQVWLDEEESDTVYQNNDVEIDVTTIGPRTGEPGNIIETDTTLTNLRGNIMA